MSLAGYGASEGEYIGAEEMAGLVSSKTPGQITGVPFIGMKMFGDEEKKVCEFPMNINGGQEKRLWSAGKFAVGFLVDQFGPQTPEWAYPIEGTFEYRAWKTSKSSGVSAHFIPNGSGAPSTSPGTRTQRSGQPSPTPQAGTGSGGGAKQGSSSKASYEADGIHFSSAEDMAAYLKKTGKGKK